MRIVSYEGLLGGWGRWVRHGLLNDFPSIKKSEYLWSQGPHDFRKEEIIVIGHSFGVRSAVETASRSQNCKLLLLLDPRMPPWGTGGVVAPMNTATVNFYQNGFMNGYPVKNAENHLVRTWHVGVPALPEVAECLEKYL